MAAASASHPPPPLLCLRVLCFLLLQFYPFAAAATTRTNGKIASLILPLKTQQVAAGSLPRLGRPPNKLYFHHNISLTVPLTVGSPPQNVSMVLDTGSELSWLRCATSKEAAAQPGAPSFRPLASSSYVAIPCASATCRDRTRDLASPAFCNPANKLCGVSLSYADGSAADGDLASDVFRVGQSLPPLRALFSCVGSPVSSSGEDAVTAGILGMNRGSLSFVSQMGARRFSYCISDRDATGVLLLGVDSAALPFPVPLNYTPLIQISLPLPYFDRVAYSVQLEGIRVGSTLLPIPKSVLVPDHTGAGQTMVDSGSQFTFLLGPAYAVLKNDLVPMEAYVIGHHHQQNVWVEYDLERARVGFAPVRCDLAGQRLAAFH